MGFFADKCRSLIDPKTGKALRGDALERARQDRKAPRCGHSVKKAARFCSKCGATAPGGWWKCAECGKWVGNESDFCWNCKAALRPEARDIIASRRWQRRPGILAERFEVGDLKRLIEKGIIIEAGTAAILIDAGAVKEVLGPGQYDLEKRGRMFPWWGESPPRTVVLVEEGDVSLAFRVEGLRSKEEIPLEFYGEAAFHFDYKKAEAFFCNFLKESTSLSCEDLAARLEPEVKYALENQCNTTAVDDLFKDPERRLHLENTLQATLEQGLERMGFALIRVSAIEFTGKEYEALRKEYGNFEVQRRQKELERRIMELATSSTMARFKTEHEVELHVEELASERGVAKENFKHQLDVLKQVHRHEIDGKEAAFKMQQEKDEVSHVIDMAKEKDAYKRDKTVGDARAEADVKDIQSDAEVSEAEKWLEVKRKKKAVEREDLEAMAGLLEGKSIQTLIALLPDAARRDQLLELHKQLQQTGQTPDQILAAAAAGSPGAAEALKEITRAKTEDRDKALEVARDDLEKHAERLERILRAALETTSEAAKRSGPDQQIIK